MRRLLLASSLAAAAVLAAAVRPAPARAGLFSAYKTYVSPQGDFQAEVPKGWKVETCLGQTAQTDRWWELSCKPDYDRAFHHEDVVFSDPKHPEDMLVVRYRQYKRGFTLRDGLTSYIENRSDYLDNLKTVHGVKELNWPETGAPGGTPLALQMLPADPASATQVPCNVRVIYGGGMQAIAQSCGNVQYHDVLGRDQGAYDLIYPATAAAPAAVMKHYRRLMSTFKVLRDGGPDKPL